MIVVERDAPGMDVFRGIPILHHSHCEFGANGKKRYQAKEGWSSEHVPARLEHTQKRFAHLRDLSG